MEHRCRIAVGGQHVWGKLSREMIQDCECGAQQLVPMHKAVWKRVPPQFGGGSDLQMCSVCGYVRSTSAERGELNAKIHE